MLAARKPWFEWIKVSRPIPSGQMQALSEMDMLRLATRSLTIKNILLQRGEQRMEEIHAVEMEAAGAGAAVRFRQTMGVLRFLMIKGISDQPHGGESQVEVEVWSSVRNGQGMPRMRRLR